MISLTWQWLTDPQTWTGPGGILAQSVTHLRISVIALILAALVAVPVGLYIGHTGRGRWLAINLAGAFRAIPSLGVLFVATLLLLPRLSGNLAFELPVVLVLVLLAVPPVLSGTYAGVEAVDPAARDAARGVGMTESQILWQVEFPAALPLLISGLRSAMLQIIATATIAAIVGIGGLGRYLIDGQASRQYEVMAGGAIVVAALALLVDVVMAGVQRLVVSRGLVEASAT
ncbi:Glycine betaine ABC transport system permease protein [Serinicoccus hydrothermalis]|uniref:Glycine betaine ABC transport system permease protein n=1 Tax=Serinicoccus hydrothermalis TaxID=1758689 RepID=A0A1B1NCH0_9MICO|nr:ABC transporter permease subunit [Serinicoccus hydrothermalis]ANS79128.1 Glycine betaine ABC transport system permease protein [Serinicoccus hydrothermalis]